MARVLAAIGLWLWCAACQAGDAATLFLDDGGSPVIRYSLPEGASEVRFAPDPSGRTHAIARRAWSFDRDCFAIERDRLKVLRAGCGDPEVRLDWDARIVDRMYPPVVRMQGGGVLVFTEYLHALDERGDLATWSARAPSGGVVLVGGQKSGTSLRLDKRLFQVDGRGWIYLGPDRFREERAGRVLVEAGVAAALEAEMLQGVPRLLQRLQAGLGRGPGGRPTLFLTWTNRESPAREVQADVVPGAVMRFQLAGREWAAPNEDAVADFRFLVAHELVHLWNVGPFVPASWASPWILEGSAELLAIAGLAGIGALDEAAVGGRISRAINECAMAARGRSWVAMRERLRGKLPYACGLSMQFAILAMARRREPSIDAFGMWRATWNRWPRYHESVLQQYLLATGADEAALHVQRMLTSPETSLRQAMERALDYAGVGLEPETRPDAALSSELRGQALIALMLADCRGDAGFFMHADHLLTAELPCGHFRGGMKVRYLEERDLFTDAASAVRAAREACEERGAVRVGTVEGAQVPITCGEAVLPDPASLVRVDSLQAAAIVAGNLRNR